MKILVADDDMISHRLVESLLGAEGKEQAKDHCAH